MRTLYINSNRKKNNISYNNKKMSFKNINKTQRAGKLREDVSLKLLKS